MDHRRLDAISALALCAALALLISVAVGLYVEHRADRIADAADYARMDSIEAAIQLERTHGILSDSALAADTSRVYDIGGIGFVPPDSMFGGRP